MPAAEGRAMSDVLTKPCYTPEDLLRMPEGDLYELVDGHLVERKMGARSSFIGGVLLGLLLRFLAQRPLGWAWPADCGYQCFPDAPNKVRKPDVSFLRFGRLPGDRLPPGHIPIPPDLAVEVISPNDLADEVDEKVEEYLGAGVRLAWVVHPQNRTVLIYRPNGSVSGLRERDELDGEDVLPGFRCRVAEVFA